MINLAYPRIFLSRHTFEVLIKAIIEGGHAIMNVRPTYTKHVLVPLWDECTRVLQKLALSITNVEPHTRTLLVEPDQIDRLSFTFRYPTDTAVTVTTGVPTHFALVHFPEVADRLANYLEWAFGQTEERISYLLEAQWEANERAGFCD